MPMTLFSLLACCPVLSDALGQGIPAAAEQDAAVGAAQAVGAWPAAPAALEGEGMVAFGGAAGVSWFASELASVIFPHRPKLRKLLVPAVGYLAAVAVSVAACQPVGLAGWAECLLRASAATGVAVVGHRATRPKAGG